MGKVIFFNLVSLDGYFEGPDRDINWHIVDDEFNEFAIQQTGEFSVLLFGRVTYELMARATGQPKMQNVMTPPLPN